jgi:hypothetical protein
MIPWLLGILTASFEKLLRRDLKRLKRRCGESATYTRSMRQEPWPAGRLD